MEPSEVAGHLTVAAIVAAIPAGIVMWVWSVPAGVVVWVLLAAVIATYSISSDSRRRRP